MGAFFEIDDGQQVARIGIAPVNAVPVDRDVGSRGLRHGEEFVGHAFEVVQGQRRCIVLRVEEEHLAAHFVDGNQPACTRPAHSSPLARADRIRRRRTGKVAISSPLAGEG
jgi:hypothetical protein